MRPDLRVNVPKERTLEDRRCGRRSEVVVCGSSLVVVSDIYVVGDVGADGILVERMCQETLVSEREWKP